MALQGPKPTNGESRKGLYDVCSDYSERDSGSAYCIFFFFPYNGTRGVP